MAVYERPDLPEDALTLPARYYVDPDYFAGEREHFYGHSWVFVGHVGDIPASGDYVLREVVDESLIVCRDDDGEVRAFYNVCRHRGTRICEADGHVSSRFVCPYHAWTFDLKGKLTGAPHMSEGTNFRKEDFPLKPVHVGVWDGLIFVNLSSACEPLEAQLADLPERFRPWRIADLKRGARIEYDVAANWKLIIQNYSECLHCPVIHPALQKLTHYLSGLNVPPTRTYLGGSMDLRDGIATLSLDGSSRLKPLPGLSEADRRRAHFFAVLPNLLLSPHPDYVITHALWPISEGRTKIVCDFLFHPLELAKPDFDVADIVAFWDLTNRQDWHVSELTQQGMKSRSYSPGPYSSREDFLYAFDRIILDAEARKS